MPYWLRAPALLGAGLTMLVFAVGHLQLEAQAFAFRDHPALGALIGSELGARRIGLVGLRRLLALVMLVAALRLIAG